MMADHEHLEELIAANALGGLDDHEVTELERERAAHGPDCAECRRLESDYGDVAGRLAFALDPVALRPGFEDDVVSAATTSRRTFEPVEPVRLITHDGERSDRGRRATILRPLVAAAAAIVLFVGGWGIGNVTSNGDGGIPAGARVVAFQGEGSGSLSVAYLPGEQGVYLLGSGLQAPPKGQVYEVWMIQGNHAPVPGPCVRPQPDGSLFAFADAELGATDTMAVTVEPAACPSAPTTPPVFTASIRA